jgi:5'-methylthioadenosine phosphorylase
MSKAAVIVGTGASRLYQDTEEKEEMSTRFGKVRTFISEDELDPEVPIVLRHGLNHTVPPHLVNYRAIIDGLANAEVTRVIGVGAVGSLRSSLRPGDIVFPDQFLDFTKNRDSTFVETLGVEATHTDLTNPFCDDLRRIAVSSANELEIPIHPRAVYACTEGPRYETAAEIRMFKMLGGDIVGMTCVPECNLARERGICYLHLSAVTNMAAGIQPEPINHEKVERIISGKAIQIRKLIKRVVENERLAERKCQCS